MIGALVGGIINWVGNGCQFNKQGLTYFGVGLVDGWASLYISPAGGGALMGGMNSVVHQGFGEDGDWNWRGISFEGVLFDTAIGGVTAGVGSKISGAVTPYVSKLTSKLGGKAIQEMATQGLAGSFTGFTISTGASLLDGDGLEAALGKGWGGAKSGWVAGSIGGLGSGLRQAYKAGENPWTGNELRSNTKTESIRTEPANLTEQLVLKQAQSGQGEVIMEGRINDPKWQGWQKYEHIHAGRSYYFNPLLEQPNNRCDHRFQI